MRLKCAINAKFNNYHTKVFFANNQINLKIPVNCWTCQEEDLPSFPDRAMASFDSANNPRGSVTQLMYEGVTQSVWWKSNEEKRCRYMKKNTYAIRRKRVTADVKIPIGIKTTLNDLLRFHPRTCRVDHFICQLYPGHPYTVFPGNEIMKT